MKILLTAGPTREPIDAVRFIGNRSSGQMGAAIASAALAGGHELTAIVGPVTASIAATRRIDVETAQQMYDAVLAELAGHDLLIMAAAVGDFRPKAAAAGKVARAGKLVIELEPTPDIVAAAAAARRADQRVIGFSLDEPDLLGRAREKLAAKHLDMVVFNPLATMNSATVAATLLWPDGRSESLGAMEKGAFARRLITEAGRLWAGRKD